MEVVRTLLIGMGQMGRHHYRTLAADARFVIAGVVDPFIPELPDPSIPLFRSPEEARQVDYRLAWIAAPTELHFELVKEQLEGGHDVFVEKPAAARAVEARQLVRLAEERAKALVVGNIERCNPVVAALRGVFEQNLLGRLVHLSGIRAGGYPAHVKPGNDVILDLGVHELDVFRMLLGPLEILQSLAHATRPSAIIDMADISLCNREGITGRVHVSWLSPERQRRIRVTAEGGIAELDYIAQTLELICYRRPADVGGLDWQLDGQGVARARVPIVKQETLKLQLDQLHRHLSGQSHHLAVGEQLIESVALIEEALARAQISPRAREP